MLEIISSAKCRHRMDECAFRALSFFLLLLQSLIFLDPSALSFGLSETIVYRDLQIVLFLLACKQSEAKIHHPLVCFVWHAQRCNQFLQGVPAAKKDTGHSIVRFNMKSCVAALNTRSAHGNLQREEGGREGRADATGGHTPL